MSTGGKHWFNPLAWRTMQHSTQSPHWKTPFNVKPLPCFMLPQNRARIHYSPARAQNRHTNGSHLHSRHVTRCYAVVCIFRGNTKHLLHRNIDVFCAYTEYTEVISRILPRKSIIYFPRCALAVTEIRNSDFKCDHYLIIRRLRSQFHVFGGGFAQKYSDSWIIRLNSPR